MTKRILMEGGDRETPAPPTANGGGRSTEDLAKEKGQKADNQLVEKKKEVCITNFQPGIEGLEEDGAEDLMIRPRKIIKLFGVEIDCGAGATENKAQSNVEKDTVESDPKQQQESDHKN